MQENNKNNYGFALFIIGVLFFIFGFITWANSQLIPYLKIACQLNDMQSYLVATAFFAAYFFMAIPSSYVLKATGFKKGMSVGLFVMAVGALLFIPAAETRNFPLFLTGLFVIGTGLALLQTASNPYAAALGPKESAAMRISVMGVCNKVAGILSVYILGSIILKDADAFKASLESMDAAARAQALDALAQKVVVPYIIIAAAFALVGLLLFFIKLPHVSDDENETTGDAETDLMSLSGKEMVHAKKSVFQFPHLLWGVLALFCYVGVEVISYDTFTGFGEYLGYPLEQAKHFATYTGYALLAGYFVGIATIPKFISQRNALLVSTILSILLVLLAINTTGLTAVVCFALLGFSNAVMWPAIFPLSIEGLGKYTKIGSALLIMAIVGGAVLPPIYGSLSESMNRQTAYYLMIPAYLVILFFAISGYKAGRTI